MNDAAPDMRPLGFLAVLTASLSLALALTYFFSPFAIGVAVIALALGWASWTHPATREMGIASVVLAALAVAVSVGMLFYLPVT